MTFLITYSLNGFTHKTRVKNAESEADAQRKFILWINKKYVCSEIRIISIEKESSDEKTVDFLKNFFGFK
jgi:hypothetical protein